MTTTVLPRVTYLNVRTTVASSASCSAIPSPHRARAPFETTATGFTRLTIRGRSHTLPLHVASEAEYERLQAPCPRDLQQLAVTQV